MATSYDRTKRMLGKPWLYQGKTSDDCEEFEVEIEVAVSLRVGVEASSPDEAEEKVRKLYAGEGPQGCFVQGTWVKGFRQYFQEVFTALMHPRLKDPASPHRVHSVEVSAWEECETEVDYMEDHVLTQNRELYEQYDYGFGVETDKG